MHVCTHTFYVAGVVWWRFVKRMETVREARLHEPSPSTPIPDSQEFTHTYVYVVLLIRNFCTLYCLQLDVHNSSELNSASNLLKATARSVGRHFSHRSMPGRSLRLCIFRVGISGPRERDIAKDHPHMVRPSSPHRAICTVAVVVFCT